MSGRPVPSAEPARLAKTVTSIPAEAIARAVLEAHRESPTSLGG